MLSRKRDSRSCSDLLKEHVNGVKAELSTYLEHVQVACSDASSEQKRRDAYKSLACAHSLHGLHSEAILLMQLSVKLQPAKEAFARAFLKGNGETFALAAAAMDEAMKPAQPKRRKQTPLCDLDDFLLDGNMQLL